MSQQRTQKLKPLLEAAPPGFLVDAAWLTARAIDRKSILNYERHGWLEKIARGLYRRPVGEADAGAASPDWRITVLSMQRLMRYNVHVGGRTALSLQGLDHYVRFTDDAPVHLYGKPPPWLKRLPNASRYIVHPRALFGDDFVGVDNAGPASSDAAAGSPALPWNWPMTLSTPERAVLELLDELPTNETFHIADTIFEGLTSARPRLLSKLLTACRSKKVKRLFFVFADRHNHAWRAHIDPSDYDLGSGPRAFVEGGRFHPAYDISVPSDFLPDPDGVTPRPPVHKESWRRRGPLPECD